MKQKNKKFVLKINNEIEKAYKIAVSDLRKCYSSFGILAGRIRFDDYWARDAFFASYGSNRIGDFEIVKANLSLFLSFQNVEGQIPRRIDRGYAPWKYILKSFGINIRRRVLAPRYSTSILTSKSVDQNSLFIIALLDYVKQSKDISLLKQKFAQINRVIDWNFSLTDNDGLIEEGLFAGWEDNVIKKGKILYTNVLHYKALKDFSELSFIAGKKGLAGKYLKHAEAVKSSINKVFWNGIYYIGWIGWKRQDYFCADGNLLAVIFGIADKERGLSIKAALDHLPVSNPPLRNNYPYYPFWRLLPSRFLNRTSGYHNGFSWLWLGCFDVIAMNKMGYEKEAFDILCRISKVIVEEGNVYEVYYNGRHVANKIFKCEVPFAWSAGLLVYAVNLLFGKKQYLLVENTLVFPRAKSKTIKY